MILIFDLDDTLYDERTYVEGGLRAVAAFGEERFGWNADVSFDFMLNTLDNEGRGAIFDRWVTAHGQYSKSLVQVCVQRYRRHRPRIRLNDHAQELLPALKAYPLYLVTDGHKVVQQGKVEALGIAPLFRRVFITHRYGVKNAKPSLYCFERIREMERCDWQDMTYVGDNPDKDFVSLNAKGANTVRVLTGVHRNKDAKPGYEARHRIADLGYLADLLPAA